MRKFIITGMAVAMLSAVALPSVASADVQRNQEQTGTLTVTEPAGTEHSFGNVWTHRYAVTVNPCDGTFAGTGEITYSGASGVTGSDHTYSDINIVGTFEAGTVSYVSTRTDGLAYIVTNAPTNG